jgi:hypothetical protein
LFLSPIRSGLGALARFVFIIFVFIDSDGADVEHSRAFSGLDSPEARGPDRLDRVYDETINQTVEHKITLMKKISDNKNVEEIFLLIYSFLLSLGTIFFYIFGFVSLFGSGGENLSVVFTVRVAECNKKSCFIDRV